jgi:hypothetical protein
MHAPTATTARIAAPRLLINSPTAFERSKYVNPPIVDPNAAHDRAAAPAEDRRLVRAAHYQPSADDWMGRTTRGARVSGCCTSVGRLLNAPGSWLDARPTGG